MFLNFLFIELFTWLVMGSVRQLAITVNSLKVYATVRWVPIEGGHDCLVTTQVNLFLAKLFLRQKPL